jgi:hypothetical protein
MELTARPQVIGPFEIALVSLTPEAAHTQRLELDTIQPILAADLKSDISTVEPPTAPTWSGLPDWRESTTNLSIDGPE